jgi:hypothetical protein
MAKRVPVALGRSIKRHEQIMKQLIRSGSGKRKQLLKQAPRTLFSLIQRLFKSIIKGKVPAPININKTLLGKVARSTNLNKVIQQNGSGVFTILAQVVPLILSLLPTLLKKK